MRKFSDFLIDLEQGYSVELKDAFVDKNNAIEGRVEGAVAFDVFHNRLYSDFICIGNERILSCHVFDSKEEAERNIRPLKASMFNKGVNGSVND